MNPNDKIAEKIRAEKLRMEQEKAMPIKVSDSQVREARFIWMTGTVAIDILTAYLIYSLTGYLPYAVIWFLAGAGGVLWSERQSERIGNNPEQKSIGAMGVKVSAFAVVAMALIFGYCWVQKITGGWMNTVMEISALVLFFYHVYQAYQYHEKDDETIARNDEARLEAQHQRDLRSAHRGARIVEAEKVKDGVEEMYRDEHGAAFDEALGLTNKNAQLNYAGTIKQVKETRPTQAPSDK